MTDQLIVERGGLEKKDKSELQAIVEALGGTATSRVRKADLIDQILELSGAALPADQDPENEDPADQDPANEHSAADTATTADTASQASDTIESGGQGESGGEGGAVATKSNGTDAAPEGDVSTADPADASADEGETGRAEQSAAGNDGAKAGAREGNGRDNRDSGSRNSGSRADRGSGRQSKGGRGSKGSSATSADGHPVGPDGEPLADWEVEVMADGGGQTSSGQKRGGGRNNDRKQGGSSDKGGKNDNAGKSGDQSAKSDKGAKSDKSDKSDKDDSDPNNRRGRRRGRGRGRDRDDVGNDPISAEPVPVEGSLDLREEGYGFLRVAGYLPSKEDVYVSVKQVRQYGLRRGDRLTGLSRPANRNEKNPGFHQIDTVNGKPPEEGRNRPRFDNLTPLFPDEQLVMSMREEPLNMTTRIIDLVAPIGKGQRGLIVSPPKAGKTTVIKDIARAIETNNPEVKLIVLLVDERPEEVTDMRRTLTAGEVASSTFDRPPEEHCAVAELTVERAKRMVEAGEDVCIILDGITRLARAYNLTAPQTGRAMSGGLDAAALYPPKRILGAARNLEEGGSLTILATALIETGSKMDEVIFEEFKGTGNMELRLDRRLAEKRVFPAIDIDASSTRNEELLFDAKQLKQAWKLRKVLSGMSEEGSSAAAIDMLIDRLQTFKTNDDFLAEIGKAPSV